MVGNLVVILGDQLSLEISSLEKIKTNQKIIQGFGQFFQLLKICQKIRKNKSKMIQKNF